MGRSNVAAESIVQRRGALDEVAAIALIFSDGIFVAIMIKNSRGTNSLFLSAAPRNLSSVSVTLANYSGARMSLVALSLILGTEGRLSLTVTVTRGYAIPCQLFLHI